MAGKFIDIDLKGTQKGKAFIARFQSQLDTAVPEVLDKLQSDLIQVAIDDIQKVYAISSPKISAGLKVRPVDGGVELVGSGKGVSLVSFGGSWGGRLTPGATVLVTLAKGRSTIESSFIPKKLGQIFERTTKKRLPIQKLFGPSVAQMLKRDQVIENITGAVDKIMSDKADELVK